MWGWGGSEQPEITQYLGRKRSEQPEITQYLERKRSEQPEITQYLGSKRSEQPEITGSNWEEKDTNSAWGGMVCEYAQDHLVSPILFVLNS